MHNSSILLEYLLAKNSFSLSYTHTHTHTHTRTHTHTHNTHTERERERERERGHADCKMVVRGKFELFKVAISGDHALPRGKGKIKICV